MLIADTTLTLEPAWPWSLPNLGLPAMLGVALLLAALTVWTYLGVRKATWRRVLAVLLLRLAALALTFFALMRPSFAVTSLDGVETSKLLVIVDRSESMTVTDMAGSARWDHVTRLWDSPAVKARLEHLAAVQKIEVVKYLGAEDLRLDAPGAAADGKRTDIGAWLHELRQKHGHEKHLRGVLLISDGADNGTRFSAQEEARHWRGICSIHTFGVGNPDDAQLRKDIVLTSLDVNPTPVPVKSKMTIKAIAQAPGFEKAEVTVSVAIQNVKTKELVKGPEPRKFLIAKEKNQAISVDAVAPDSADEYKVTLTITPHPDEAVKAKEISTYVQVIKKKTNILWVDRPRVYEPVAAIRAIKASERFDVHYVVPPLDGKGDTKLYLDVFDEPHDVIVIGDISAQRFSLGNEAVFAKIKTMVQDKRTGLLMLGGEETFGNGGWQNHPKLMELLPVTFDKPGFVNDEIQAIPTAEGLQEPFLRLDPDAKKMDLWKNENGFEALDGLANTGSLVPGSKELIKGKNGQLIMASTQSGKGRTAVLAADSTAKAWRNSADAVRGYNLFWKQLVLWLAQQQDDDNLLWVRLDKRRINAAGDFLNFEFGLRDKKGKDVPNAKFSAEIVGPKQQRIAVKYSAKDEHQRGTVQGVTEPGEYTLVVKAIDQNIETPARFLVVDDDIEKLRPAADHETLRKIAAAAEGRFALAAEGPLLQYLDELQRQVNSESRHKTTQWPDWKRLPPSDHLRDQLAGLWNSFALVGFLLFTALIGCEWLLRRMWGLV